MRPVLQLSGLSGLLVTSLMSTYAFAEEATNTAAQPATDEPRAEQPEPVAPAATPPAATPVVVAPAATPLAAAPLPKVGDVSMNGYFRIGYGVSSEKGRQVCFKLNGALSKFRLGNECDQYGEFHFSAPIFVGNDGVVATAHFMPAVYMPSSTNGYTFGVLQGNNTGLAQPGANWQFPFFYMDMKGISWLAGGTPWVGQRYYKREDWHSTDFFYWNPSGLGAGIEDINLGGDLRLSYAAFKIEETARKDFGVRNDIQLRGIQLYPGGELQLGLDLVAKTSDDPAAHSGFGGTVRHVQTLPGGGWNKLAVQYGQGAGAQLHMSDSLLDPSDRKRLRIVELLYLAPSDWFSAVAGVIYQHDMSNDDANKSDWISAGVRGSIGLADHAKLLIDIGHDNVKPKGGDRQMLTKITIAPAFSAGKGVWDRPELRLFCTIAMWNDAAKIAGVDDAGLYGTGDGKKDKNVGATFGVHSEVWW